MSPIVLNKSAIRNMAAGMILIATAITVLCWAGVELPQKVVDDVVKHIGLFVCLILAIAVLKGLEWLVRFSRGLFVWKSDREWDENPVVESPDSRNW
jgi:hypothetical protein